MKEYLKVELVEVAPPNEAQSHWLVRYIDQQNQPCGLKIPRAQGLKLLGEMHSLCVELDIVPPPAL